MGVVRNSELGMDVVIAEYKDVETRNSGSKWGSENRAMPPLAYWAGFLVTIHL
jgi:hypothetical protein